MMREDLNAAYSFRSQLVEELERDLLGPGSQAETIDDPPITKYVCGVLYPQPRSSDDQATLDQSQDIDETDEDDETAAADPPVAMANIKYPSSMGITFAVSLHAARSIRIKIEAGRYTPAASESAPANETSMGRRRRRVTSSTWARSAVVADAVTLDVSSPDEGELEVAEGLGLYHRIRPAKDGVASVTVALINRLKTPPASEMRDGYAFFQPQIVVDAPTAPRLAFADRRRFDGAMNDSDRELYRLLYRDTSSLAVGHGCSVDWEITPDAIGGRLTTRIVPRFDLLLSESNPDIVLDCLSMRFLEEGAQDDVIHELRRLPEGYRTWIEKRRGEVSALPHEVRAVATQNLAASLQACDRILRGIEVLAADKPALDAFRLTNRAMRRQRARSDWFASGKATDSPDDQKEYGWYPFQLAFILLCLEGIANATSSDREIADLLWFPTGGGKTEAYLGLIAFTLFLRRLRDPIAGSGVTALMRYTLRLLTIQQFERAAILICACESIRRSRSDLGKDPISIGLWVGQDATPNTRKAAGKSLDKLRTNPALEKGNPVQLHSCPWCGKALDHRNYYIAADNARLVIDCRNNDCLFRGGLPVLVVDEDLYDHRPTLVVATADKFASLPWRDQVVSLFNGGAAPGLPPELIIQDELHLISGPLGTLAGLYETVIDAMCTSVGGARPKVVASTATIRRATEQARALFDREVRQFPPPALEVGDSYFARLAPASRKGSRLYVGLMAPGTSQTTLLVRAYSTLLQRVSEMQAEAYSKDPYWTLVGYFNSLRVLGGARMAVQDDVDDRMDLLAKKAGPKRRLENQIELTSREPSAAIPDHLKKMGVSWPDRDAVDVILATNMISVGVDVKRLGLMVVMGQPQSTSEYIQATSRVGREHPGLVVVLLNAARSRDRSHYENFVYYHAALYRQVEATSLTPFSARARARALHAALIALARLRIPELRGNESAPQIAGHVEAVRDLASTILSRVRAISPLDYEAAERELDELITWWVDRAQNPRLVYRDDDDPGRALLVDASNDDPQIDSLRTLWSLRDVDKSSNLYLVP